MHVFIFLLKIVDLGKKVSPDTMKLSNLLACQYIQDVD